MQNKFLLARALALSVSITPAHLSSPLPAQTLLVAFGIIYSHLIDWISGSRNAYRPTPLYTLSIRTASLENNPLLFLKRRISYSILSHLISASTDLIQKSLILMSASTLCLLLLRLDALSWLDCTWPVICIEARVQPCDLAPLSLIFPFTYYASSIYLTKAVSQQFH